MEILRLKERINIAIELGESHFREFKSGFEGLAGSKTSRPIKDVCRDISKTLVAFANADGGELLVGVEDDGEITGLDYDDDLVETILNAPKKYVFQETPLPTTKASIVEFNGMKIAYFSIPKGTDCVYITSEGKCLKRKDLESIPVSPKSIQFERAEKESREYDRNYVDGADINDLNIDLLTTAAKEFSQTISPEKFLQHLDLADFDGSKLRLRKAALLVFAKVPQKWHPRLQVRLIKVNGTEIKSGKEYNVVEDKDATDNILTLLESAWDLLRPYLTETKLSTDALFKNQIIYPELACREALTNAIAHRDYSIEGRGIEIFVFDDRMEVKSPGELLSSVSIQDIKKRTGVHQSRNTHIARLLREIGYMRELGEGFRRIYELMENNDLTQPELFSENQSFIIVLKQKLVYSEVEKLWLENFKGIELSREERTIVRIGASGNLISPKQIWDNVGIVDTDVYRQLLESLKEKGLLISEVAKPQALKIARAQKVIYYIPSLVKTEPQKKEILDDSDYAKIYIENIPFDASEEELVNLFSNYGEVVEVRIPKSHYSNKGRGFAFIEFENKISRDKVMADKFNIFLKKRKVIVKNYEVKRKHSVQ